MSGPLIGLIGLIGGYWASNWSPRTRQMRSQITFHVCSFIDMSTLEDTVLS